MKKYFLVTLFIVTTVCLKAQDKEIDSLKTVIEKSGEDSLKVKNLVELGRLYSYTNPNAALKFANLGLELAEKIDYKKGIATAYKCIGIIYYRKGTYVDAISNWKKSSDMFAQINDKAGVANIQSNIAAIYFNQGNQNAANEYYFGALTAAEEIHDTLRIVATLNGIGAVYQLKKKTFDKALEFYHRALSFADGLSRAEDLAELIGAANAGIGEVYMYRDSANHIHADLDTARFYFITSLQAYMGTVSEPYTLNKLGELYMMKNDSGDVDSAILYQRRAIEIAKKFESKDDVAISLIGLAQAYEKKGETKTALAIYKEAEDVANEVMAQYSLQKIYMGQAGIYNKQRDYTNAFKYQYMLNSVKDSIYNIEADKKLQGIQFTFDLQKKESELAIQKQEVSRQKMVRNSFVGGFAVVLLFAGIFFSQRNRISKEKKRSDELLLNILPSETAEELKATGTAKAKSFEAVTVMFTDFKNFTQASELLTPEELVKEINYCYSEFDKIITKYGIEKIKTIGDSYMCAGGLPVPNTTHPIDVVKAGLEMQQFILKNKADRMASDKPYFDLRLGIHTGPVVAGIVGIKKFAYDIWGDTVNTASRMESSGEIGKVNISGVTYELIKDSFKCFHRGKVEAKNKGHIDMYFVESGEPVSTNGHSVETKFATMK